MHPRQQIRNEIETLVSAALPGVPVFDSRVSDIDRDPLSVLIFSTGESVERAPGSGQRGGTPLIRRRQISVVIVSVHDGDDDSAMRQADDASRAVELALNAPFDPGLDLLAVDITQDAGEQTVVQIGMLYEIRVVDAMNN